MGDAQRLSPDEQITLAREQFESGTDFTVAVEEEFAVLDPESLGLVGRFEELQAAAKGTELEEHLVGELISSEVEVRTGRCETFAECAARLADRRSQLLGLADPLGIALCATGTHPWSPWQEQHIIDTPHYRSNDELLRYVAWRNNTFGLHVHVGIRGADRAVAVCNALRAYLPDLLALSASSPFAEGVYTHLHSARTQLFTRMFPRCGVPDAFESWREYEAFLRFLYGTGSVTEHTQLWWSVRLHLAYPTVEIRICDGQPELAEARSLAALAYALAARVARAIDEGEPLPVHPHRLIEENLWRAIRHGLSGSLIALGTDRVRPARRAIEELVEWVLPVAEELGAAPYLAVPQANAAERQIERIEQGATLEQIYAEQVARTRDLALEGRVASELPDEEVARQVAEELRKLRVEEVLIQTLVTISSIGYRRLGLTEDTRGDRDLAQSRLAIETMRAVTPVLEKVIPGELLKEFHSQVAALQLAYAKAAGEDAAGSGSPEQGAEPPGDA